MNGDISTETVDLGNQGDSGGREQVVSGLWPNPWKVPLCPQRSELCLIKGWPGYGVLHLGGGEGHSFSHTSP